MENVIAIGAAFLFGGILKGAVGAGAPLIAVPLLALLYDVPFAVAVFVIPNLLPNIWQAVQFRASLPRAALPWLLGAGGALGAWAGSHALVALPASVLKITLCAVVVLYILFRVLRPDAKMAIATANRAALPVGVIAGGLQGAAGVSAPVSVTFLNSVRIPREAFIATISIYFVALGIVQMPVLAQLGVMTWERLGWSFLAVIPLFAGMPIGARLVARVGPAGFDRVILAVLAAMAMMLAISALGA